MTSTLRPRRSMVAVGLVAALTVLGPLTACDPTTGRPPAVGATVPAYTTSTRTVTRAELGTSWSSGCPVGAVDLRAVTVAYWGYDGARRTGTLIVHRKVAADVRQAFGRLYAARFQIERITPVTTYGASDDRSMAANNTSAFNCRRVTGGTSYSEHSYGWAIDLNPVQNPYVRGGTVLPPSGVIWADRSLRVPGMIHAGGAVDDAFAEIGWYWGGRWSSVKDYQHLSYRNR
ncbi:MAG: M15 family metallopeptidase [Actinobacteria bacterium]|nr:M15 family metallopeptidase [Actinomycetota bacterium]